MQNDKLSLLRPGSLQHLGENMLAFLLQTATSSYVPKGKAMDTEDKDQNWAVFFDVLVYNYKFNNFFRHLAPRKLCFNI